MNEKHLYHSDGRTIRSEAFEAADGVIRDLVTNLVEQGYPPREIQVLLTDMVGFWSLSAVYDKEREG